MSHSPLLVVAIISLPDQEVTGYSVVSESNLPMLSTEASVSVHVFAVVSHQIFTNVGFASSLPALPVAERQKP
jgi:hypothetical protein